MADRSNVNPESSNGGGVGISGLGDDRPTGNEKEDTKANVSKEIELLPYHSTLALGVHSQRWHSETDE